MDMVRNKKQYKNSLQKRNENKKSKDFIKNNENQIYSNELLFIIAHDIKGPIASCSMLLENIVEDINSYDKKDIKELLIGIKKSMDKMNSTIFNSLTWIKLNERKIKMNPEKINIENLLRKILEEMEISAKTKKVNLFLILKGEIETISDIQMIEIVLRNILSNAIKFSKENGKVIISLDYDIQHIRIYIKDNGIGINNEKISKIFLEDGGLGTYGTQKERGTGTGLKISKKILDLIGGEIEIKSIVDKGTEVLVKLPIY